MKWGDIFESSSFGRQCFLWRGVTMACLKSSGNKPSDSERLINVEIG